MSYYLTDQAKRDFDDIYYAGAEQFGLPQAERYAQGPIEPLHS